MKNAWILAALPLVMVSTGLADSGLLYAPRANDIWPTGGGNYGMLSSYTVLTDDDGRLDGILNYFTITDMSWNVLGHQLDLHEPNGAFVETVATDTASGWSSFVAAHEGTIYTGRTSSGLDPDNHVIERAESGAFTEVCQLMNNYDLDFAPDGSAYATALLDGNSHVVKVDLAAGTYDQVARIGGKTSGLTIDPDGDLWVGTFRSTDNKLLRFGAADIDPCQQGFSLLGPSDAAQTVDVPLGVGYLASDEAGNVCFSMNSFNFGPEHELAVVWDGGSAPETLSKARQYISNVEALGDVSLYDELPYNAAYTAGYYTQLAYVPEPVTLGMLAAGLAGLVARRRRRT